MADFTTVQVSELPPNAPTDTSILAHQVGDVLSRMTLLELITFVGAQASAKQYEIKYIRAPDSAYITDNFDMSIIPEQGIGKVGGLWEGWAICNGNNGTDNIDGQVLMGWGAVYNTVGDFIGEATHLLTVTEMPSHSHPIKSNLISAGGGGGTLPNPSGSGTANTEAVGGGVAHNNIQPSMVVLIIMKL